MKPLTKQETLDYINGRVKQKQIYVDHKQIRDEVSRRLNLFPDDIDLVINTTLDVIGDFLLMSNRDQTVTVNIGKRLNFRTQYVPCRTTCTDNYEKFFEECLKHRVYFSQDYIEQSNQSFREKQDIIDLWQEAFQNEPERAVTTSVDNYATEALKRDTEASTMATEDFTEDKDDEE